MDTIFALASAQGKAGVAVIRVSGDLAWSMVARLVGPMPEPRRASLRKVTDPENGFLDEALVLCFDANASFTGEQVVELHLHGSQATISATLRALGGFDGLRIAEPGEFTRKALENGRLDLAQVEGLGDLIEAETEAQRRQALRVFDGALGQKVENWRKDLIRAAALLEATIDFADEDVPTDVSPEVKDLINTTRAALEAEIKGSFVSERIRDGFEVAIVGPPNVGKSTLLNTLAGRDAAITSEIAGTTRDVIEVRMDLKGLPVVVLDTAGIRETADVVEGLGIERARDRANAADLRVFLSDGTDGHALGVNVHPNDIIATSKSDITNNIKGLGISAKSGQGIDALVEVISNTLLKLSSGAATATRERHRTGMTRAISYLDSALSVVESDAELAEIAAENLHQAIRALDSLIGRVDVENILDEIFSSFCLGK